MDRVGRAEYSPQFVGFFLFLSAATFYVVWNAVAQGELPLEGGGPRPSAPPADAPPTQVPPEQKPPSSNDYPWPKETPWWVK